MKGIKNTSKKKQNITMAAIQDLESPKDLNALIEERKKSQICKEDIISENYPPQTSDFGINTQRI